MSIIGGKEVREISLIEIIFMTPGWEDYLYWQKTDKKMLKKGNELIR